MAPPPPPPSRGGDLRGGSASSELQKQHHQGPTSSAVISANSIHHQQHHAYSATSQQSTSSQSLSSPAHLQQPGGINAGPFVPNSSLPTFIKHKIALHQQQAGTNSASSRGPPPAGSSAAGGSSASRLRAAAAAASGQHHQPPPQHVPHQGLSGANGSSHPNNNLAPMASSLAAKLQSLQLTGGVSSRGPTGSRGPPPPPIITPPPSYSASRSSSSGPQSPSLVSSSSDYSSVPPFIPNGSTPYVLFQNLRKNSSPSPGSQGPSQSSSSSLVINGSASSHGPSQSQYHSSHSSHLHQQHHPMLQPSSSRKAVSQSPIIMQSVKSQKINKPILQTAIGPNHAIKGYASTPSVPGAIGQGQQSSSMSNSQMTTHQTVITTNTHQGPSNVQRGLAPPTPPSPLYISGSSSSNVSFSNIPSPVPSTTSSARSGTSSNQQRNPPPPYSSVHHQLISGVPNGTAATVTPRAPSSCGSSSSARTSPRTVPDTTTPGTSPAYPPPPYSAAIQSVANRTRILDNTPPPPLPPNYPMAALEGMPPAAQQELIAQLMSNMMSANPSPPSLYGGSNGSGSGTSAGPTSSHQVPTTEPPSYASSMAAIAAQRAAAVAVANGTAPGAPAPPAWIAHRPLPAPPPSPPVPSSSSSSTSATTVKSNLVNTVESICNSQISALQATARPTLTRIPAITDSTVPPLPPKPNAAVVNAPPPPLPIISEQLSTTSSSEDPEDTTPPMRSSSPIPPQRRGKLVPESTSSTTISTLKGKPFSPAACKFYMEQHFENLIKSQKQREIRRQQLETEMTKCNLTPEAKCEMRRMLHQKESNYIRLRRAKMDRSMFDKIRTIGVGAFGEVALVRKKDVDVLYAMKTLRKVDVFKRNQVAHVKAERDILAEADNEWVVRLYFSFQDETYLYFVMDYIPGGDLMSLLIKLNIFEEPLAQFYIAELVCAVESVHKMGFIHRDIKPDNVLIDRDGHIKLTDFGLCTGFRWTHNSKYYNTSAHERVNSMDFDLLAGTGSGNNGCNCNGMTTNQQPSKPLERRKHRREHQRCLAHSLVGTPNYIAPEVLMRLGYTQLCDWWSVGVILYEMVVGSPPFYAASAEETQQKVINWRQTLQIPPEARLSSSTRRLITQLCCGPENRLGRNGAEEIKAHPFFASIDFESGLRNQPAPYVPVIEHPTDTSNFDDIDPAMLQHNSDSETSAYDTEYVNEIADQFEISGGPGGTPGALRGQSRKHRKKTLDPSDPKHPQHAFFEFTFRRFFDSSGQAIPIRVNAHGHHHHGGEVSEAAEDNESMLYGSVTDGSTTATSTTTGSQVSSGADLYGAFEGGVGQEGLNSNPHQTEIDSGIPKRAGSGSSSTLTNGGSGGSSGGAGAPKNGTIPIISAVTS